MLPLTAGFLIAGPISGTLSDRYGPRPFATAGLVLAAICFGGLMLLPVNFSYWVFALLILTLLIRPWGLFGVRVRGEA